MGSIIIFTVSASKPTVPKQISTLEHTKAACAKNLIQLIEQSIDLKPGSHPNVSHSVKR